MLQMAEIKEMINNPKHYNIEGRKETDTAEQDYKIE